MLASAVDESGQHHPALIVQRFGQGRSAALTFGDLWRWQLKRQDDADDLGKAWRQLLRWMVADVPDRIEMQTTPSVDDLDNTIHIQVRVRDTEFKPLDNATVSIDINRARDFQTADNSGDVRTPDSDGGTVYDTIHIDAEPSLQEAGLYEAKYRPRQPGAYLASVKVKDGQGKQLGSATSGWTNEPSVEEFRSIEPNRNLMKQIAQATGGELVAADRLDEFVASLSTRAMPVTEKWTSPLWDQPWVFLLAISCLVGEWGLRRWKGLP